MLGPWTDYKMEWSFWLKNLSVCLPADNKTPTEIHLQKVVFGCNWSLFGTFRNFFPTGLLTTSIHVLSAHFTQIGRWEMALWRRCIPDKKFGFFSGPVWPSLTEVAQSFQWIVPSEPPSLCKISSELDCRSYSRKTDFGSSQYEKVAHTISCGWSVINDMIHEVRWTLHRSAGMYTMALWHRRPRQATHRAGGLHATSVYSSRSHKSTLSWRKQFWTSTVVCQ